MCDCVVGICATLCCTSDASHADHLAGPMAIPTSTIHVPSINTSPTAPRPLHNLRVTLLEATRSPGPMSTNPWRTSTVGGAKQSHRPIDTSTPGIPSHQSTRHVRRCPQPSLFPIQPLFLLSWSMVLAQKTSTPDPRAPHLPSPTSIPLPPRAIPRLNPCIPARRTTPSYDKTHSCNGHAAENKN
jgi:hypothetical protein